MARFGGARTDTAEKEKPLTHLLLRCRLVLAQTVDIVSERFYLVVRITITTSLIRTSRSIRLGLALRALCALRATSTLVHVRSSTFSRRDLG